MVSYLITHEKTDKIVMDPQTWNKRALRVYEKCGFVKRNTYRNMNGMKELMVDQQYRRNGIAKLLMETAESRARAEGRSLLVLDTRSGDPSNLLYRSLGYIEAGRIPKYAKSSDGNLDETTFYYKEI